MSDNDSLPPSSDDILIPGFSQRHETADEVEQQYLRLEIEYAAQQQHREIRAQRTHLSCGSSRGINNTNGDGGYNTDNAPTPRASALRARDEIKVFYEPKEALDSQTNSQEWLEAQTRPAEGSEGSSPPAEEDWECDLAAPLTARKEENMDDAQLDFELLRLQFYEMEDQRDQTQAECARLQAECARLQAKLRETQTALKFFQKETGRWRWAAASTHTKIQAFLRDLGTAAMVLRFPDGQPSGSGH